MAELGRINVFYSYAHADEPFRETLVDHLAALQEEGVISQWHDRQIVPSADWRHEISTQLSRAHIVLFLVSPAFMQSPYCTGVEVQQAVELHWHNRCRIIPVILHPTPNWTSTAFGSFQALPKGAKPISSWSRPEMAFYDVALGIRAVCKDIVDWENPYRRARVGDWVEYEQQIAFGAHQETGRARFSITAKDSDAAIVSCQAVTPAPATFECWRSLKTDRGIAVLLAEN
jgi:hypothetical protein